MAGLWVAGTLLGAGASNVHGITDLEVKLIGGSPHLFAATGSGGGIYSFAIAGSSSVTLTDHDAFTYATMASPIAQIEFIEAGGMTYSVPFGRYDWNLDGYAIDGQGELGTPLEFAWGTGGQGNLSAMTSVQIGAETYLYGANFYSTGICHYRFSTGSLLELETNLSAPSGSNAADIVDLETASFAQDTVLLALSQQTNGITSYVLDDDGAPIESASLESGGFLPISTPTGMSVCEVAGKTYAVIASFGSGSLTVVEVSGDGTLRPTDHILDDGTTRFARTTEIESVELNGRTYIVAGGSDDGLSLFTLLPDGSLVLLDSIADSHTTSLMNVAALEVTTKGGQILIFATSETEAGITQINYSPGPVGLTIQGTGASDTLAGGIHGDIINGWLGNDSITGGGGDDILQDGAGVDTLTGGAGADLFVLVDDDMTDTILDFQPGVDKLDLSKFHMLYDVRQLQIISRPWGADIVHNGEVTHVYSANGNSLDASDFSQQGLIPLNRPPSGFQLIPDTFHGTDGDDILSGDDGTDTLNGKAGDDLFLWSNDSDIFNGGSGFDVVSYAGAGIGATVNLQKNTSENAAQGDQYTSIEALVGSDFGDQFYGNEHDNILEGGTGDDTLDGGDGGDILDGGAGNDTASYARALIALELSLGLQAQIGAAAQDTLINIENIEGTNFSDQITGDAQANTIAGGAGNDILSGALGNDSLLGGAGNDILDGGAGADFLDGGSGSDWVVYADENELVVVNLAQNLTSGGAAGDVYVSIENVSGSAFDDNLIGDVRANKLNGGSGNDTITGADGSDILRGGSGDDLIVGGNGNDLLVGDKGNDTLIGSQGRDRLYGGEGEDSLQGGNDGDFLYGGGANDFLSGSGGNDYLNGGHGNDVLAGGVGVNSLSGWYGNDTFISLSGKDRFYGGPGVDTVDYSNWLRGVVVNLNSGKGGILDRYHSIESVIGGAGKDIIHGNRVNNTLSGGQGSDRLYGGGGNDTLHGDGGLDRLSGGAGNDHLFGGAYLDVLNGGSGNDILTGGSGPDHLNGGSGIDIANYSDAAIGVIVSLSAKTQFGGAAGDRLISIEQINGSHFGDKLSGNTSSNVLRGGAGNDTLNGQAGYDRLYGGAGDDYLRTSVGGDHYDGGSGTDTLVMSWSPAAVGVWLSISKGSKWLAGSTIKNIENLTGSKFNDVLSGDTQDNVIKGAGGHDLIRGHDGDDTLLGGNGHDKIYGSSGTDTLHGNAGNDTLSGGYGDDTLAGGYGNDILVGGAGIDTFFFNKGQDQVMDFEEELDEIALLIALQDQSLSDPSDVMNYVELVDGDAVFDFADGSTLTIDDIGSLDNLVDQVFWF